MKILFVACYSPFINNSAAIRTLQYLNKLSQTEGYEVDLLTVNFPKDSLYYDENLALMMDKKIKVHQINGGAIFNRIMPRKAINNVTQSSTQTKKQSKLKSLRKIKNAIVIPDMYRGWAKKAAKYGIKLLEEEKFDLIFSMHEPPSAHLCAYYIKKRFPNIRWITYWSDPWLKDSTRQNSIALKRLIEKSMEKNVMNTADEFIFVTNPNRKDYIDTYSIKEKDTYLITRGFDMEFYNKLEKEEIPKLINTDKINILYAGEIFSKLRDVRPFIKAIRNIELTNKELYNKLNILFFGNIDDEDMRNQLKSLEAVTLSGRIPFEESVKYMLNSDILLLFGNKNSTQIPAKIYDYFGAKGKVLVIYGDDKDPLKDIVEGHSKCACVNNSHKEIEDELRQLIKMKEYGNLYSEADLSYEWNSVVQKLIDIFDNKKL